MKLVGFRHLNNISSKCGGSILQISLNYSKEARAGEDVDNPEDLDIIVAPPS